MPETGIVKFKLLVPDGGPRVEDLAHFLQAVDSIYKVLAAVEVFGGKPFDEESKRLRELPREYVLRIPSLLYASEGQGSLFGIDGIIKVVLETIRDFTQKRAQEGERTKQEQARTRQEEEKVKQERQATIAKRIENTKEFLDLYERIKSLPREDQERIMKMIAGELAEIEDSPTKFLPS
mgnify:CR=1 FL=1